MNELSLEHNILDVTLYLLTVVSAGRDAKAANQTKRVRAALRMGWFNL